MYVQLGLGKVHRNQKKDKKILTLNKNDYIICLQNDLKNEL